MVKPIIAVLLDCWGLRKAQDKLALTAILRVCTPIQEEGKEDRSIHYAYAKRQLWCKDNFNIPLMSHLMIKLRLPTGQIFSYDAQTPGQEIFSKVEKYWRRLKKKCCGSQEQTLSLVPTYIFRLGKLGCGECKGFIGFIFA